jgi:hypothetical protein
MNLKSNLFVLLIVLCVLFAITGVSAADDNQTEMISDGEDYLPFSELSQNISASTGEINLEHDYKYDSGEIEIAKEDKFVINGNGHKIEGVNDSRTLVIESSQLVEINNLTFQNCANTVMIFCF